LRERQELLGRVEAIEAELARAGALSDTEHRVFQDAILAMARHPVIQQGDVVAAARVVTEIAARAVAAERVSVWRLDEREGHIILVDLYVAGEATHSTDLTLTQADFPNYFDALLQDRAIDAHDAHTDPRTREFSESYLTPLGITSLLDAPIRVAGKIFGVVCFEQVGPKRQWKPAELSFAGETADQIAQAVMVAETRALALQLQHAQKLESLGMLAGGVAHDFNNILVAILGNLELAEEDVSEEHPAQELLQEIRVAAERAAQLTRRLLAFGRRSPIDRKVVDVASVVRGLEPMLRRLVPESIEISVILPEQSVRARLDVAQIEQVIMNLVVNARDAMSGGGRLSISLTTRHDGWRPDVVLSVSDTGVGISAVDVDRIFEPFFSTKPAGEGTGLGLSMAYGIVQQHGGTLEVDSEPGAGSSFWFALPITRESLTLVPSAQSPASGQLRGSEILLVEDDPAVRRLAAKVLRRAGHRVVAAEDGASAIELFGAHPTTFDVVVMDMVMPHMNGDVALRELRKAQPGLPALFTTGHGPSAVNLDDPSCTNTSILQKPYAPERLLAGVRELLGDDPRERSSA